MNDILRRSLAKQKQAERDLFKELRRSYRELEKDLMTEADAVLKQIDTSPNKTFEYHRIERIINLIRRDMQRYATEEVIQTVATGMVKSTYLGSEQATAYLRSIAPETVAINTYSAPAIREFTRFLTTGPLGKLFAGFGQTAADRARRELMRGLALGHNPTKIARSLRKSLGVSKNRALLIARTETMRAHREGNRQTYLQNQHIVEGWIWHAAASPRTCAVCWAMHGREFPLNEPMAAHPACRCSMVPKTKSWRQLGFGDIEDVTVPQGEELFEQQDDATKKAVLGTKYEDYKQGKVKLEDFVAVKNSQYGKTITKKVPK